jgi:dienelactone hydrolase
MAEQTDQLEKHIQFKRTELGQNLEELESKVKRASDWHTYFERYPMTALGLSFGGGILLSMMLSNGSSRSRRIADSVDWQENQPRAAALDYPRRNAGGARDKVVETVDTIKSALLGLATAKVHDILSDAIPGFREQFQKAERHKDHSSSYSVGSSEPLTM